MLTWSQVEMAVHPLYTRMTCRGEGGRVKRGEEREAAAERKL